jgi:hypothetical protein
MTTEPHAEREAVRRAFPNLSESELGQAVVRLREYFRIAADICARERKSALLFLSEVDSPTACPTMKERSNDSLKN